MPVRRLTSLREAEDSLWLDPADPGLWRVIASLWRLSLRLAPGRFPPGVHRAESVADAGRRAASWADQGPPSDP